MAWYKKSLLKVKDIEKLLPNITKSIKDLKGVKEVYVWGSYLNKENNKNSIIKDVDILAKTIFNSGDFLSIINDEMSPLTMTKEALEDEGFDPKVVKFPEL